MSGYAFSMLLPGGGAALMGPSLLLILGGTSLLAAYGLYMVKSWSWTLTLVLSGFGTAGYLFNIVSGRIISIARII